eukprot:gene19516-23379_t
MGHQQTPFKIKGILPPRVKGRGATDAMDTDQDRYGGDAGTFEPLKQEDDDDIKAGTPIKSIEGWILMVTGLSNEVQESDLRDLLCEYGVIRNVHLNYDRRSGYCKGYALVEYESKEEAELAIAAQDLTLAGSPLAIDYAFVASKAGPSGPTIVLRPRRERESNYNNNNNRDRGDRGDRGDNRRNNSFRSNKKYHDFDAPKERSRGSDRPERERDREDRRRF